MLTDSVKLNLHGILNIRKIAVRLHVMMTQGKCES